MNKDQVQGKFEEAKGKIKETAGRITGKPDLEDEGTAQKIGGKVQKGVGDVEQRLDKEARMARWTRQRSGQRKLPAA